MPDRPFHVIENEWIMLADGTRLAARIWMPEGAGTDPVPAVLEFLPYRKRDGTAQRDESTYPAFAAAGIAGVRVDIRGSGESGGVIDGEYTGTELSDACELIAWIAARDWCNGNVGMMGISWGGFNGLQVAALRPPALKAVISIASTTDRYNDDVHYKNGCHLYANLSWAATMQAYQSRPPDPALVGDDWRAMWLERLRDTPNFLHDWLGHQRRDEFWRHGSICEDWGAVEVPVLVIAGWGDGYRNTPFEAVAGLGPRAKAIVGPWIHKYPHFAWPQPRMDFLAEAVRWWNRWLKGEANGVEDLPQVRLFRMEDMRPPAPRRDRVAGTWLALDRWSDSPMAPFHADAAGGLLPGAPAEAPPRDAFLRSPLDTGVMAGEWFTLAPDASLPGDQRADDAGSLCVDTAPLGAPLDIVGRARLALTLACDGDLANLCARLVDLHPDGTATRIAFGVLNLAHRDGNEAPEVMPRGTRVSVTMRLDACGYRLLPGHRLRLAISTAYWPTILPPPADPGVTIDIAALRLDLPQPEGLHPFDVPEPEDDDPLPHYIRHGEAVAQHRIERDRSAGTTRLHILDDTGTVEHPETGISSRTRRRETWTISDGDPTSAEGHADWICETTRPGWSARTDSWARLSCDGSNWIVASGMRAGMDGETVFEDETANTIPRDFM